MTTSQQAHQQSKMRMAVPLLTTRRMNRLIRSYPNNSFICDHDGNIKGWKTDKAPWATTTNISQIEESFISEAALGLLSKAVASGCSEQTKKNHHSTAIELSCTPISLSKKSVLFVFTINHSLATCTDITRLQEKLTQSHKFYSQLFFQLDSEQKLVSHNTAFSKLCINHNPNVEQLLHKSLSDVLPEDLAMKLVHQASLSMEADLVTNTQILIAAESEEEESTYLLKTLPIKSAGGEIVGALCVGQLSDPIKIPPSKSDSSFETELIANLPSLIYWKDKEQTILGCNLELLNCFQESLPNTNNLTPEKNLLYKNINPEETKQILENDLRVLKEGRTLTFYETVTLRGKKHTYISEKKPLTVSGKTLGVCGVSIDISSLTEKVNTLKKRNSSLQNDLTRLGNESKKTEEHLNWIIDHLPGNVFWENKEGEFLGCNKQLVSWLGLSSKDELVGKNLMDMVTIQGVDKASVLAVRKNDLELMKTGKEKLLEESFIKNGEKYIFLSHKSPMMAGNECIGIIGIGLDITHQKHLEEKLRKANRLAENALQAKSDFIANISHDLRTPLHTLYGTAEQLENEEHLPSQNKKIETLTKCSRLILRLIDNVLHFSQLKDGTIQLHEKTYDLKQLLDSIIITFQPLAKKKNIALSFSTQEVENWFIHTDANALSRILINLIQNAMKYTEKGEINLTVIEKPIDSKKSTFIFNVRDTGTGIQKDELTQIFSRFFQGDQNKGNGLGLGLSITQRFTELMSGKISVESEWGKGSTFSCSLPITISVEPPEKPIPFSPSIKRPRILLVEDNELIQTMTVQTLKKLEWDYELATTGEEALLSWRKDNLSLILLDLGLPDQHGLTVLSIIRKSDKTIPVITLTGDVTEKTRQQCLDAGANQFLAKPASQDDLLRAITTALNEVEKI